MFKIHSFIFMLNNWHLPIYVSLCACYSAIYLLNHINGDDFHTHIHIHVFKSLYTLTILSDIVKWYVNNICLKLLYVFIPFFKKFSQWLVAM